MTPKYKNIFGLMSFVCSISLVACAPEQGSGFDFSISFADLGQAQTGTGIPEEVQSIRLAAYDQFGASLASQCISLPAGSSERTSVSLDLAPGAGIKLEVEGWDDSECGGQNPSGPSPWYGSASAVVVSEGRQTPVVLQVRRMGNHLNPLRDTLSIPRAFGTATYIGDDEVLVAGGYSIVSGRDGSASILEAACSAEIVDIGSATVKRTIPMQSCRGLHQALSLSDGRVVLLGGSQKAIFDPRGSTRPVLRPKVESLLQGVEIFNPEAKDFSLLSVQASTMRAMASGALLDDDTLIVSGGRTSTLRSSDVVCADLNEYSPSWNIRSNGMVADRMGAAAILLEDGLLTIGGNLLGQPDAELLPLKDEPSVQVQLNGQQEYSLALSGHAVDILESSLIITGGIENVSGASPVYNLLWGTMDNGGLSLLGNSLVRERAYHSVSVLGCGEGEQCLAVFGGLDSSMKSVRDAELVRANSDGQLLSDGLDTGAVGAAAVSLPDGSVLVLGGLDVDADGTVTLSSAGQILTP